MALRPLYPGSAVYWGTQKYQSRALAWEHLMDMAPGLLFLLGLMVAMVSLAYWSG